MHWAAGPVSAKRVLGPGSAGPSPDRSLGLCIHHPRAEVPAEGAVAVARMVYEVAQGEHVAPICCGSAAARIGERERVLPHLHQACADIFTITLVGAREAEVCNCTSHKNNGFWQRQDARAC